MFKEITDRNLKFYEAFIDLKVVGWKSYSAALNDYTQGTIKTSLDLADRNVETLGSQMKGIFASVRGVCK